MKLSEREQFIMLIDNEPLKKADAIILLEGDGFFRVEKASKLFFEKWAPIIVVSGVMDDKRNGSFPAPSLVKKLIEKGVSEDVIMIEKKSLNTREQAEGVMKIVKEKKWGKIILIASHYHQYRAFLTFLKVMQEMGQIVQIINAPAREIPWFLKNPWGKRMDLLKKEFEKIEMYPKKGDIANFENAIKYQQWKEQQP